MQQLKQWQHHNKYSKCIRNAFWTERALAIAIYAWCLAYRFANSWQKECTSQKEIMLNNLNEWRVCVAAIKERKNMLRLHRNRSFLSTQGNLFFSSFRFCLCNLSLWFRLCNPKSMRLSVWAGEVQAFLFPPPNNRASPSSLWVHAKPKVHIITSLK